MAPENFCASKNYIMTRLVSVVNWRADLLAWRVSRRVPGLEPAMYQSPVKETRLWICLSQRSIRRSSPPSLCLSLSLSFTQPSQHFEWRSWYFYAQVILCFLLRAYIILPTNYWKTFWCTQVRIYEPYCDRLQAFDFINLIIIWQNIS